MKIAHYRLPSASQKRACLSSLWHGEYITTPGLLGLPMSFRKRNTISLGNSFLLNVNSSDYEFHNLQLFTVTTFPSKQKRPQLSSAFIRCRKPEVSLFLFFCTSLLIWLVCIACTVFLSRFYDSCRNLRALIV